MDAMYEFVKDSEAVLGQVENVYGLLKQVSFAVNICQDIASASKQWTFWKFLCRRTQQAFSNVF